MSGRKSHLVKQHLLDLIEAGLAPHERLPAERELAEQFSMSRLTVRKALDELESAGVVYRVQGAGTFVKEPRIAKSMEFTSFSEDMQRRGMVPGSLGLSVTTVPIGMTAGYALGLSPTEPAVRIERIRTADERPMCFEICLVPASLVPGLVADGVGASLYGTLRDKYGIVLEGARQQIRAGVLEPEVAARLEVPPFSPAFHVTRTSYDERGTAVEYAESYYRGDRYSYELTINRHTGRPPS